MVGGDPIVHPGDGLEPAGVDMDKIVRIYESGQGQSKNILVIDTITLVVHSIDERTKRVLFTVNPNITEYKETATHQAMGYEAIDDTRQANMTVNDPPFTITIDGTKYQIALHSIGTTEDALGLAYCDFVINW